MKDGGNTKERKRRLWEEIHLLSTLKKWPKELCGIIGKNVSRFFPAQKESGMENMSVWYENL